MKNTKENGSMVISKAKGYTNGKMETDIKEDF